MREIDLTRRPSWVRLGAAFAAVYLIWGSTYLAIRYAIETLPPLLMAGSRFIAAGALLYGWARLRGAAPPDRFSWRPAVVIGALLLLGGNGLVVWSEQWVASGLVALLLASEPLMVVLLDWVRPGGTRPGGRVLLGLLAGFAGIALLIGRGSLAGTSTLPWLGVAAVLLAALSWASGSLYARRAKVQAGPVLASGMQMLAGGTLLLLTGSVTGEWGRVELNAISGRSLLAVGYLIIFGSLVGFTAYSWLLRVTTPARASTHAYVNPVVAVLLGWLVAGEPVSLRMVLAMGIILAAVLIINTYQTKGAGGSKAEAAMGDEQRQRTSQRLVPHKEAEAAD